MMQVSLMNIEGQKKMKVAIISVTNNGDRISFVLKENLEEKS